MDIMTTVNVVLLGFRRFHLNGGMIDTDLPAQDGSFLQNVVRILSATNMASHGGLPVGQEPYVQIVDFSNILDTCELLVEGWDIKF